MDMSNLPRDLIEEILSKLPFTSLNAIRLTCRSWNTYSKSQSFAKKHISKASKSEVRLFIMLYFKISLMGLNLHTIHNNVEPSVKRQGEFTESEAYDISQMVHCDGLLLCIKQYNKGFVVWNPYLGQKKWFKPRSSQLFSDDVLAIGYEENKMNKSRIHKILRFLKSECEIYDFESDSWRFIDVTLLCSWDIKEKHHHGVSVKGNTYWIATTTEKLGHMKEHVLICFDFTRERFGPWLHFPFQSCFEDFSTDILALSSVREEKLVVLRQRLDIHAMEIWVTSEINPESVLWSKMWLAVDMGPSPDDFFRFPDIGGSFLIDEEKKLAMVIVETPSSETPYNGRIEAFIIGVDGCLKQVDLRGTRWGYNKCMPLVCGYVPSCVHIY